MNLTRFFIACEDGGPEFYVIEICKDETTMHARMAEIRGAFVRSDREARACCLRYIAESRNASGRLVRTPELGTIFFNLHDMSPEVVAHELAHAAIGWAKRKRVNPCSKHGEERFACVQQRLNREFYRRAAHAIEAAFPTKLPKAV